MDQEAAEAHAEAAASAAVEDLAEEDLAEDPVALTDPADRADSDLPLAEDFMAAGAGVPDTTAEAVASADSLVYFSYQ